MISFYEAEKILNKGERKYSKPEVQKILEFLTAFAQLNMLEIIKIIKS